MSLFSKKPTAEPQNIDEILAQFKSLKEECEQVKSEMAALKKESVANVDKIGMVRFNPFEGFGGNQSFSLAILNGNDNSPKKKNKPSKSRNNKNNF
jgi:hypothetical protein